MAGREATAFIQYIVNATVKDTTTGVRLSVPEAAESVSGEYRFNVSGIGDLQCDRVLPFVGTLSTSGTADLDFAGAVDDSIGQSVTMTEICAIMVRNRTTTAGAVLRVGGTGGGAPLAGLFGATNDYINVGPGGIMLWVSPNDAQGVPVTATTADILRLTNASGSSTLSYEVLVLGRSA